jgi:hypothetical protein
MRPRAVRTALCALVAAIAVMGVGPAASPAASSSRANAFRKVALSTVKGVFRGDTAVCASFTARYIERSLRTAREESHSAKPRTCAEWVVSTAAALRQIIPHPDPRITKLKLSGDRASYLLTNRTADGTPFRARHFWVRRGGRWKLDREQG